MIKQANITNVSSDGQTCLVTTGDIIYTTDPKEYDEVEVPESVKIIDLTSDFKKSLLLDQKSNSTFAYDFITNEQISVNDSNTHFPAYISSTGNMICGSSEISVKLENANDMEEIISIPFYWKKDGNNYKLVEVPTNDPKVKTARFTLISENEQVMAGVYVIGKLRRAFTYNLETKQFIVLGLASKSASEINCLSADGTIAAGHYQNSPAVITKIKKSGEKKHELLTLDIASDFKLVGNSKTRVFRNGAVTCMSQNGQILAGHVFKNKEKMITIWVATSQAKNVQSNCPIANQQVKPKYKGYTISEIMELTCTQLPKGLQILDIKWISDKGDELLVDTINQEGNRLPWRIKLKKSLI